MYDIYNKLLANKGLKNADIARATGISNMTLSDWKKGKSTPKADKLQKIADFLDVSLEYLMTGKEKQYEMYSVENAELLVKVTKNKDTMRMLEYYMKLSDSDKKELEMMAAYKANKKE